jgi:hypothetical protein
MARLYQRNIKLYEEKARAWTRKYASARVLRRVRRSLRGNGEGEASSEGGEAAGCRIVRHGPAGKRSEPCVEKGGGRTI